MLELHIGEGIEPAQVVLGGVCGTVRNSRACNLGTVTGRRGGYRGAVSFVSDRCACCLAPS